MAFNERAHLLFLHLRGQEMLNTDEAKSKLVAHLTHSTWYHVKVAKQPPNGLQMTSSFLGEKEG